jgi:transcriptional regulator with XRE-family HTH domain
MAWGSGDEARGDPISQCVPHCDRASFDCQHIRLHHAHRFGLWHGGKWIDWTQLHLSVDRRVGPEWATTPKGRDADIRRRHEAGETQQHIADIYEVDRSTISRIVNGNPQRPLGRYGDHWHVKRPTQAEYDRIARELSDLLDERDARLQRIRSREEAVYSSLTHDYFWNGKRFVSIGK